MMKSIPCHIIFLPGSVTYHMHARNCAALELSSTTLHWYVPFCYLENIFRFEPPNPKIFYNASKCLFEGEKYESVADYISVNHGIQDYNNIFCIII